MKIRNVDVIVKNGNIAMENVDCIVVPEFTNSASYGGVGGAIAANGMCSGLDRYEFAVQKKPLKYGEIMITDSGKNNIQLAHVATAGAGKSEQFRVVFEAILRVLQEADKRKFSRIAIPELGTGIIGRLTQDQSARVIFSAIDQFSIRYPDSCVKEVRLVIFRNSTVPAETVLASQSFDFKIETGEKKINLAEWLIGMGLLPE